MLHLQRASAGSGKTYTLAKKFIWYLIAIKDGKKGWRLRTPREITDGVGRILAITFTNKATNEMKQRIVSKLADLSRAAKGPVSEAMLEDTAYLAEFSNQLGVAPENVGQASAEALSVLLNDYSDFRVSTIDSFFQTVLRTFAYESNLNDTYQVEIESDYLAAEAIDATLDNFNNPGKSDPSSSKWLRILVDKTAENGEKWNIFQKSGRTKSVYGQLMRAINKLENEEFKGIRNELDSYFNSSADGSDPLLEAYTEINRRIAGTVEATLGEAQSYCRQLIKLLADYGIDPKSQCQQHCAGHLVKLMKYDVNEKKPFVPLNMAGGKTFLKKGVESEGSEEIEVCAYSMYKHYSDFRDFLEGQFMSHWKVYAPLIPLLGLLGECRREISSYLEQNNMIQLAETNSMLHRIIGEDDAPFVYERIGTRLNHYLIDEFQDTSRMQWQNLRPLLMESDSRGEDNLIIGDAKQSIYRFRNADPSIITTTVPEEFPGHVAAGYSVEDNTNWRSDRRVVEFNNLFFQALVKKLADVGKGTIDYESLYENVVQHPSHRKDEGYVEIRFSGDETVACMNEDGEEAGNVHPEVPALIAELVGRGYRFRDIAVLVKKHSIGDAIIKDIITYNESVGDGGRRIDFISEESLLVSSAEAVDIIISVLRKMTDGSLEKKSEESGDATGSKKGNEYSWNDIKCNFSFYALSHPGLDTAEQISRFLREDSPTEAITSMLSKMQTVALPALIEAITESFVPENLRRSQGVYIAGLQDMVLEYCERYAADVFSFLEWWDTKGVKRSISSPEGTDAVEIMTFHKSKGLEFKCVILPEFDFSMVPSRFNTEWRWVRPADCMSGVGLPPFLPVETLPQLEKTTHKDEYERYHDLVVMDNLNSAYVAFTRAVSELYIFTSRPAPKEGGRRKSESKESTRIGHYLNEIACHPDYYVADVERTDKWGDILPPELVRVAEDGNLITIGKKSGRKPGKSVNDKADVKDGLVIEEYGVDSSPVILQYVEGDDDSGMTVSPEAADTDPRSEGNLLHAVMSGVRHADDLHPALLALRMRGMITNAMAEEWEKMLGEAMSAPEVSAWFSRDWRVVNERQILIPGKEDRRPDRVMISSDRKRAVVVDYKFGEETSVSGYRSQVADYVELIREATGIEDVSGYLWYVRKGIVEKIC